MSNSPLVVYTRLSPHCNKPRNKPILKITPHHMAGNITVETCGAIFAAPDRKASSNYGIDSQGHVGMYVEEHNRSWCSSSPDNDHQAITIEVVNDSGAPDWHVSDKALEALIDLCVDICQRNNIPALNFTGDATGNLTMHKWFAATGCPGPYLGSKFPYIAEEVNKRLKAPVEKPITPTVPVSPEPPSTSFEVRVLDPELNIRQGPGTHHPIANVIRDKGVYTIVEQTMVGSTPWGRLKSGAGWISLGEAYCRKV